jgi:hypothetical protein
LVRNRQGLDREGLHAGTRRLLRLGLIAARGSGCQQEGQGGN